jgi:hypothetical protein
VAVHKPLGSREVPHAAAESGVVTPRWAYQRGTRTAGVNTLEVSTDVRVAPTDAFEFLLDFPGYARYSEHLDSVTQHGPGGAGTEYDLRFSWWKLSHTVRSQVTGVDPPGEIRWELEGDLDASGQWLVEPTDDADGDGTAGSTVTFAVTYDPGSAHAGVLDLPAFVSADWVVDKLVGLVVKEGERVVERVVADLEGEPRDVELTVDQR